MSKNQQNQQRSGAGAAAKKVEQQEGGEAVVLLKFKCSVELVPGGKVYRPDGGDERNGVYAFTQQDAMDIQKAGNSKYLEALINDKMVEHVKPKERPESTGDVSSVAEAIAAANKANTANAPGMNDEQKAAGEAAQKAADANAALLAQGAAAQAQAQADAEAKKD